MQYPLPQLLRYPKVNTTNPKVDLWLVDLTQPLMDENNRIKEHTKIYPPISLTSDGEEVHFSWVTWADSDYFAVTWMNRIHVN